MSFGYPLVYPSDSDDSDDGFVSAPIRAPVRSSSVAAPSSKKMIGGLPAQLVANIPPEEMAMLRQVAGMPNLGIESSPFSGIQLPKNCRGNQRPRNFTSAPAPLSCDTLGCDDDCDCTDCPDCRKKRKHSRRSGRHHHRGMGRRRERHPTLRPAEAFGPGDGYNDGHGGPFGPIEPTEEYLEAAAVPSQEQPSDHPLVILSLEGVLGTRLPAHLSGGHTDFLSRGYLTTLMDYLLHPDNRWSVAFWTGSMTRKQGLKCLEQLQLPTGSPEKDERDGVVGLWSKEDLRDGFDGGELAVKDLEIIWKELEEEEGIRWTLEDTIVITDYPGFMKAQPNNFVLAPSFHYKTTINFTDDQFLLMMIAILEDLTTESNFAAHIKELGWDQEDYWLSPSPASAAKRDFLVHNAVRVAAKMKIGITATGGN
ncbi:hypothetical protein T439DRAFT_333439 [Meredithblackwellia eburnea MCA 4105]